MRQRQLLIVLLLFIVTVCIRIPVLRSVGETWDEYTVVNPGETYVSAFKNLDFGESAWIQNYEHPPVAKYLYGLSRLIPRHFSEIARWDEEYPFDKEYTIPRLLAAILGGLTVVLVFLIGQKLFSSAVGLVASLILTVLPSFVAYTSMASLEAVFIFFTTLFIYLFLRALNSNSWQYHLLAVLALALCFATRYNGLFFVIFYAVVVLVKYRQKIPWPVLLSPMVFLATFFILWPWLWLTPVNLIDSLLRSSGGHVGEYFLGSLNQPDWYYYFIYFLATTPEVILLLLLGLFMLHFFTGEARFAPTFSGSGKGGEAKPSVSIFILAWFLTPFLASASAFKQDGIRYVIAFAPALALISGYFVISSFNHLKQPCLRIIFASVLVVGLLYPIIIYFPYYLDYYNLALGGPKAAYEKKWFEVGWWGEGGLSAVRWINVNAPSNSVIRTDFAPRHVLPKFRGDLRLEQNFVLGNKDDFILINTYNERYGDPKMLADLANYKLVYEVSTPSWDIFKASLVRVYKRR